MKRTHTAIYPCVCVLHCVCLCRLSTNIFVLKQNRMEENLWLSPRNGVVSVSNIYKNRIYYQSEDFLAAPYVGGQVGG